MDDLMKSKPEYIENRLTAYFEDSYKSDSRNKDWAENFNESDYNKANLVLSSTMNITHKPVIDLDFESVLIPSTSKNHYHLYLNKEVAWDDYLAMLRAMQKCGIVQKGWVDSAEHRGYSAVRRPGKSKPVKELTNE